MNDARGHRAAAAAAGAGGQTGGMRADARRNHERILRAAEAVFAEKGPSAATEEVARRAGVAIGTVFRHFPTKQALLQAIMKDLLERLTGEVAELVAGGDPATAFFDFFGGLVTHAAEKKTVVDLLSAAGVGVPLGESVQPLRQGVEALLTRAQRAGAVRADVDIDTVMALLTSTCQGALVAGWDARLRERALEVVFAGLRAEPPDAAPAG